MERRISRHYTLTDREIRDAILDKLNEQDVPVPKKYDDVVFTMTENSVTLEWTDTI